jgi:hypothetical protein
MRAYVVSQTIAAALFAPCAAYLLTSWPLPMAGWIRPPVPGDVLYVLEAFAGGPLLLGSLVVLAGAAVASVARSSSRIERDRVTVLLLWAAAPLALDYAFSFVVPSFLYRYLLYASLGLFLVAAHGLARLPVGDAVRWTCLVALLVPGAWSVRADPILRPDWRGAARIALEERADGAITIVTPPYQILPFSYHYARDAFADHGRLAEALRAQGVHALPSLDGVARATGGRSARVVIVAAADAPGAKDVDAQMSAEAYRVVRTEELTGVRVRVFEKS